MLFRSFNTSMFPQGEPVEICILLVIFKLFVINIIETKGFFLLFYAYRKKGNTLVIETEKRYTFALQRLISAKKPTNNTLKFHICCLDLSNP